MTEKKTGELVDKIADLGGSYRVMILAKDQYHRLNLIMMTVLTIYTISTGIEVKVTEYYFASTNQTDLLGMAFSIW